MLLYELDYNTYSLSVFEKVEQASFVRLARTQNSCTGALQTCIMAHILGMY